jgi:adenylate kinase
MIVVLMGVSGVGETTIGKLAARDGSSKTRAEKS